MISYYEPENVAYNFSNYFEDIPLDILRKLNKINTTNVYTKRNILSINSSMFLSPFDETEFKIN